MGHCGAFFHTVWSAVLKLCRQNGIYVAGHVLHGGCRKGDVAGHVLYGGCRKGDVARHVLHWGCGKGHDALDAML